MKMTDKERLEEIKKVAGLDYLIGGTKVEEYWDWLVKQVDIMQSHAPEGRNYTNAQYVELLQENELLKSKLKKIEDAFGDKMMDDLTFINEVGKILESVKVGDQEGVSENRTLEDWLR